MRRDCISCHPPIENGPEIHQGAERMALPHYRQIKQTRRGSGCVTILAHGPNLAGSGRFSSLMMAKALSRDIPYLTPRPFEDGSGWYVEAQWVGRSTERLGRFAIYAEASDWIALQSAVYFVLRELEHPVKHPEPSQSEPSMS